jgi:hypothetical protein
MPEDHQLTTRPATPAEPVISGSSDWVDPTLGADMTVRLSSTSRPIGVVVGWSTDGGTHRSGVSTQRHSEDSDAIRHISPRQEVLTGEPRQLLGFMTSFIYGDR